jgi:3-oxoacyl-[acyl-carrier protein] reductase
LKKVFVSGSSRGVGKSVARIFLENGYFVYINGNKNPEELTAALNELRALSQNVEAIKADVGDFYEARKVFERAGHIDVLVNNASVSLFGLFTSQNKQDFDYIIDNNIRSAFNCSRFAAESMIREKRGAIVNISSVWGIAGASCEVLYSAGKGAINAFTKALAKELGPSGVTVNAVAAGLIDTKMNARLSPEETAAFLENVPLGKIGSPEDVARAAFFLAREKYVTGQILNVDGGLL